MSVKSKGYKEKCFGTIGLEHIYICGGDENLTITESCDRHSSEQFHLSAGYIDFIVIKTHK